MDSRRHSSIPWATIFAKAPRIHPRWRQLILFSPEFCGPLFCLFCLPTASRSLDSAARCLHDSTDPDSKEEKTLRRTVRHLQQSALAKRLVRYPSLLDRILLAVSAHCRSSYTPREKREKKKEEKFTQKRSSDVAIRSFSQMRRTLCELTSSQYVVGDLLVTELSNSKR